MLTRGEKPGRVYRTEEAPAASDDASISNNHASGPLMYRYGFFKASMLYLTTVPLNGAGTSRVPLEFAHFA